MSEDITKNLPEDKAPTTQPMLEAILAKVNELDVKVTELDKKVDEGFARVNVRLDTLENDTRENRRQQRIIQRQQLDIEDRLEELERKAS